MELDYGQGLQRLEKQLPPNNSRTTEKFDTLKNRLTINLYECERYGRDAANTVQLNHIIDDLDTFIDKDLHLAIRFLDLCKCSGVARDQPVEPQNRPAGSETEHKLALWRAGDKLSVQGEDYYLDGSIQVQWLNAGGALFQRASGRQARSGQRVWLKQCQLARAQGAALTLKRDLEKEERLLLDLQREGQRDFPRALGRESNAQRTILIHELLSGRSLASAFDGLPKPLDQQATRRLLTARHTLIQMLNTLHKKKHAHRMLTPETLLLRPGSNKIILVDTGLAARTIQPGEGPQFYQSPEQVRGLPAPNYSTDIYQLGALFYDLLTGRPITEAASSQESGLEPALDALLRKAAAPFPGDRWPNVYAFSNALRQLGY